MIYQSVWFSQRLICDPIKYGFPRFNLLDGWCAVDIPYSGKHAVDCEDSDSEESNEEEEESTVYEEVDTGAVVNDDDNAGDEALCFGDSSTEVQPPKSSLDVNMTHNRSSGVKIETSTDEDACLVCNLFLFSYL